MFNNPNLKHHPEWRELYEKIQPMIDAGQRQFSYGELAQLFSLDPTTSRGRQQFYKFRKQALAEWHLWFEVEPGVGYNLIEAGDHSKSAVKRVRWAGRKVRMARAINTLVRIEQMTPAQRLLNAQTAALLEDLSTVFSRTSRQFAQVASKLRLEMSSQDLETLSEETETKKAPDVANSNRATMDLEKLGLKAS